MKTFVFAVVAALLIASQLLTPVAAAPVASGLADGSCGDTYTVQYHDYLALIAQNCGISVSEILALNPQIVNQNLIFAGQVLRMNSSAPAQTTPDYSYYPYYRSTTYNGYARVSLSTTRAPSGGDVTVSVSGFPANANIDYRVGRSGEAFSVAYDGQVNAYGNGSQTIAIPGEANNGEYWVVQVLTTELVNVTSVTSSAIYITDNNYYYNYYSYGYARVSLSKSSVVPGGTVTVYVSGFPANAYIDIRAGIKDQDYSIVYDGKTNSNGATTQTITIPADAVVGDYWTVRVMTTELKNVTSVTSYSIHIVN